MRAVFLIAGLAVLLLAWAGPLPRLASASFAAHMAMHMAVVAVAAPLLALGLRPHRLPPASAVLVASLLDLAVVWGWHMPAFHLAARASGAVMAIEQGSFLLAGLALWLTALAGARSEGALAGAAALLVTSMHMTLLGVLLALAPLPLFHHGGHPPFGLAPEADREIGGILMLAVGGVVYLLGGLLLAARLLRPAEPEP